MKNYVIPVFLQKPKNRDKKVQELESRGIIYAEWLDLLVVYCTVIPEFIEVIPHDVAHKACMKTALTKSDLDQWGVTKEWLHCHAVNNLKLIPYTLAASSNFDKVNVLKPCKENQIKLVTTGLHLYGSSMMLDTDLITRFTTTNCYILPQSVDCIILVEDDGTLKPDELVQLVIAMNITRIEPDMVLCDSLYYFNWSEKKIEKVR